MKLERIITTEANVSTISERLATYFGLAGYHQSISRPHIVSYQRGKFLSLSAKGCPVNAVIQLTEGPDQTNQVLVTLEIDTTGQLVLESERKYWREQLNNIERAVLGVKGH